MYCNQGAVLRGLWVGTKSKEIRSARAKPKIRKIRHPKIEPYTLHQQIMDKILKPSSAPQQTPNLQELQPKLQRPTLKTSRSRDLETTRTLTRESLAIWDGEGWSPGGRLTG